MARLHRRVHDDGRRHGFGAQRHGQLLRADGAAVRPGHAGGQARRDAGDAADDRLLLRHARMAAVRRPPVRQGGRAGSVRRRRRVRRGGRGAARRVGRGVADLPLGRAARPCRPDHLPRGAVGADQQLVRPEAGRQVPRHRLGVHRRGHICMVAAIRRAHQVDGLPARVLRGGRHRCRAHPRAGRVLLPHATRGRGARAVRHREGDGCRRGTGEEERCVRQVRPRHGGILLHLRGGVPHLARRRLQVHDAHGRAVRRRHRARASGRVHDLGRGRRQHPGQDHAGDALR